MAFKKVLIFTLGMGLWLPMIVGVAVKYWLRIGTGGFTWGLWHVDGQGHYCTNARDSFDGPQFGSNFCNNIRAVRGFAIIGILLFFAANVLVWFDNLPKRNRIFQALYAIALVSNIMAMIIWAAGVKVPVADYYKEKNNAGSRNLWGIELFIITSFGCIVPFVLSCVLLRSPKKQGFAEMPAPELENPVPISEAGTPETKTVN